MKKRILSILLLVCMLATMVPFAASAATAEAAVSAPESTDADYAKLYVQSGLVHAYMAYDSTSYDIAKGVWYDLVGNANGAINGGAYDASTNPYGWQVGANGGLSYTDPDLKSAGKTALQWTVGTGEGQLALPETFNVEYVASHEMRNMSQANLWVNSTVTSSAIDGSTDVLYTITMPNWNNANMMRLWVNFAGTAGTKYSITFGSNAANLGYKKDITIGSDGTAGMNDGSGVYTRVTKFYVRVPAGLTVTSAKVLTSGNELAVDGAFQIGSLRTMIWSNLNGGNSWGNGGGSVRWFVGNNNFNGGGVGCTIIEGEERSFLTYEGTAITMNVLKKPATVDAGTSASYTFGYGTYTKTYTPAATSAVLKNDSFVFQQALGGTAYALRIYDRELTVAEKNLNHLVDILAYTRYDIAKYNALSAETKTALATSFAKVTFTGMSASDVDNEIARVENTDTLDNTLYVQSGLVALFVADASVDVANKVWYNRVAGAANATLDGTWRKTADGAVHVNGNIYGTKLPNGTFLNTSSGKIGNTLSVEGTKLNLGTSLLPDHDFTVQMTAAYDDIYARNFDTNLPTELWTARVAYSEGGMRFRIGYFATWCHFTGTYGSSRYTYTGVSRPWQDGYSWDTDRNDFRNMAGEGVYTETITRDEAADELSATYKQLFDGAQKASWAIGQSSKAPTQSNYKADESSSYFYLFQAWPVTVYSVAVYDRILTDAEMKQNHAADLIEYYNLDASMITGEDANESLRNMFIAAAQSYKIDPANYEANRAALAAIVTLQGEMNEYDELYVQDGLTALYNAYDLDDKSVDFENGLWYNKLGEAATMGNTAVIAGRKYAYDEAVSASWGWQKGANGGFAISYTQPVWSKYVNGKAIGAVPGISLDTALIRNDEYTVEVVMELEYLLTADGDAYIVTESTAKYGLYNSYAPIYRLGEWAATAFIAKGHSGASFGQDRWCYHDLVWANHNGNPYGGVMTTWRANLGLDDIVTMTITQAKGTNASGRDVSTITIRRDIDANVNTATSNGNKYWAPGSINDFTLMNGIGGVMYAIRTYNRILTIAEMNQNHFADIAAYLEIDLTEFNKLSDEEKTQVYTCCENTPVHKADKATVEGYLAIISGGALADTLYVTEGLVGFFTSYKSDVGTVDLGAKSWLNLVDTSKNVVIAGDNWKMNADGSFGNEQTLGKAAAKTDYFGNVWYDRDTSALNTCNSNNYLNFGAALLPVDDFTIEIVTNYHKVGLVADDGSIVDWKPNKITNYYYRATDVASGATSAVLSATALTNTDATTYELLGCSYANQNGYLSNTLADAIGYLKSFAIVAGLFEGNGNYCYRWYVTNGNDGWTASGYTMPADSVNYWEDKGGVYSTVTGSIQTKTFTREKVYTDDILTSVVYEISRNQAMTTRGVYPVLAASDANYRLGKHYPTGAENQFYLFKNQPVDVYAARIYDRVLTLEEQLQNKAADLVKYYGLDLTKYNTLTDAQKAEARSELADLGFGSTKAVAQATFDAIASAAFDANGLTQYDKAYVQEGLVGLFTAYETAETSLSIGANTWKNKVGNDFATVLGGSNYWFRGENGGLGYHLTPAQWSSVGANGKVGIALPEEFAELKNFTVESVAETYGLTNEDGSVYYNVYKAAHTDANGFSIAASGAVYGQFSSRTAGYRFGLINALSWASQYPNTNNALGYNRWMYAPGAYVQHNWSASSAKWFATFGSEGTLLSYNYAAITMQFMRTTEADGAVTFAVGANGATPTMTGTVDAAKVAELEALTGYTKDNAGAFSLYNGVPSMVYAIRVYDRALTAAEVRQNHFVDIAAYFGLDLSKIPEGEEEIFYASFENITFAADRNYVQGLYAFMTGDKMAMADCLSAHVGYAPLLGEETGYRVLFELSEDALNAFKHASYTVQYGAIVGVGDYGTFIVNTVDDLTVRVANGMVTTDAENAKVVVVGGTDGTGVLYDVMGDKTLYSVAVTATPEHYGVGIIVRGFVSVTDPSGVTNVVYLEPAEDSALSGAVSVMEAADYFVNEYDSDIAKACTYMNNASLLNILSACGISARETIADHLVLYVDAENGSDENNGLRADAAFKSVEAAVNAAKAHSMAKNATGVTIKLAAGEYNVDKTIDFDGDTFATDDYFINIVGEGADTTILDGSVAIDTSSATLDPDTGLYVVDVPGANFRYLYADGEIVPTVKMGDEENFYTINSDPVVDEEAKTAKIYMDSSLFDGYSTYQDTEVHITIEWKFNIIHIEYVDYDDVNDDGEVAVYVDYDQFSNMAVYNTVTGRQYWLEAGYDLLAVGAASGSLESSCYYFDEATHTLYYYDADGDFESKAFAHGGIENMFYFRNIDGLNISDLAITGIDNKYVTNEGGLCGGQAGSNGRIVCNDQGGTSLRSDGFLTLAAIYGSNITNATFKGLAIYNVGGDGLSLRDKVENVTIDSNTFEHIGETAIRIGSSTHGEASGNNYNRNVVIADNYINGTGEFFKQCCGMLITNGARVKIVGNTVVNTTYTAISIGWKWSESTLTLEQIKAENRHHLYNVEVAYNYITNFMTCMRDGGGIYILGGNAENSETSYFNYMHDNYMVITEVCGKHDTSKGKWFMGYYHDGSSSNWYDYNNVVVNATTTGVGNFVPYYVQGIQSQLAHNVKLYGNYGIGFANGEALYRQYNRISAERNIVANDYIFTNVAMSQYVANSLYGNSKSLTPPSNAKALVASIFMTAGVASTPSAEKLTGGISLSGAVLNTKDYVIDGEYVGSEEIVGDLELDNYTVNLLVDGKTVKTYYIRAGETLTINVATPTKAADAQYTYTFAGWEGYTAGMSVYSNMDIEAKFDATVNEYTITFINGEDMFHTVTVPYGTKVADIIAGMDTPTKEADKVNTYAFAGWYTTADSATGMPADRETVEGNKTYYATYRSNLIRYTYKIVVYNPETGEYDVMGSGSSMYNSQTQFRAGGAFTYYIGNYQTEEEIAAVDAWVAKYKPAGTDDVRYVWNHRNMKAVVKEGAGSFKYAYMDGIADYTLWNVKITENTVFELVFTPEYRININGEEVWVTEGTKLDLAPYIDAEQILESITVNGEVLEGASFVVNAPAVITITYKHEHVRPENAKDCETAICATCGELLDALVDHVKDPDSSVCESGTCIYCGKYMPATTGHYVTVDRTETVDAVILKNDTDHPFAYSNGWYTSTNKSNNSISTFTVTATYATTLEILYSVSSETDYDKLTILKNGSQLIQISGEVSNRSLTILLAPNDVVRIEYSKDVSVSNGDDCASFSIIAGTQTVIGAVVNVPVDEMQATCEEGVVCDGCGEVFKAALGHDLVAPTCTESGKCTRCSYRYGTPLGHIWTSANCLEPAICERCGASDGEPLGHLADAPTCTMPSICERCDEIVEDALGHDLIDPTCTERGKCTRCSYQYGDVLGHEWLSADCLHPVTCERCGETDGEALGHDWIYADCLHPKTCERCGASDGEPLGHLADPPTCTMPSICERCDEIVEDALGHDLIDPTCTERGKCTRCSYQYGNVLGHDWLSADCLHPKTCERCGKTDGEALGHSANAPTCTLPSICERCNETLKDALGHMANDPTCTLPSVCKRCGELLENAFGHVMTPADCLHPAICERCGETEGEALGHDAAPATCTESSLCSRCGHVEEAFGHAWGAWKEIVAPTYTADGEEKRVCEHDASHVETRKTTLSNFVAAWSCGNSVNARLYADEKQAGKYTLHVFGTGDMNDYAARTMPWYSYLTAITEVIVYEGVSAIGASAFRGATSLTAITLPSTLSTIGESAFRNCTALASLSEFKNVMTVGKYAFYGCSSLTSITFGENATLSSVGTYAFAGMGALEIVTVKNAQLLASLTQYDACGSLLAAVETILIPVTQTAVSEYIASCYRYVDTIFSDGLSYTAYANHAHVWEAYGEGMIRNEKCTVCGVVQSQVVDYIAYWDVSGVDSSVYAKLYALPSGGYKLVVSGEGEMMNWILSAPAPWYEYRNYITEIIVEDGVTSIGNYAFYNMGIKTVKLPDSVETVGNSAFRVCSMLQSADLGRGIENIGSYCFYNCSSLISCAVASPVFTVGDNAFAGCDKLSVIPQSVSIAEWDISAEAQEEDEVNAVKAELYSLGNGRYRLVISGEGRMQDWASNLNAPWYDYRAHITEIVIKDGVTTVGNWAFYNTAVEKIVLPESVVAVGNSAFRFCQMLKSFTSGVSMESIGTYCFYNCTRLVNCTLKAPVFTIGTNAFTGCIALSKIPVSVPVMEWNVSRTYSDNVIAKLYSLGGGRYRLVLEGEGAMVDWTSSVHAPWYDYHAHIVQLDIKNGIINIGNYAFYNLAIESVVVPDSVTFVGNSAFRWCSLLKSAKLGKNAETLGTYCFYNCAKLTECTSSAIVLTIGNNAFANCPNLTEIPVKTPVASWDVSAKGDGSVIAELYVTHLGNYRLRIIGKGAMKNFTSSVPAPWYSYRTYITELTVADGITYIGDYAFYSTALKSVVLPESVTAIGNSAFRFCSLLENITFGKGVLSIGSYCFYNCAKLTALSIFKYATIGNRAFDGCPNLVITYWGRFETGEDPSMDDLDWDLMW